ncbi:hypothetical protein HAALTHF_13340n [Vreelandella aquamarina]|nr:hypothetical protein HAALTHF_13340n [Halomonas axialensis]
MLFETTLITDTAYRLVNGNARLMPLQCPSIIPQLGVIAFNCGGPEFQISREKLEESIGPQLVQLVNDIKTQIS